MFENDLKTIKLFVSHIEDYSEYNLFLDKLNTAIDYQWEIFSDPNKIGENDLKDQINPVEIVIILSGQYSKDPSLIKKQIRIAKELEKPIIAVRPFGMENVPEFVENVAQDIVGWNTPCIVDIIEENALII
ncbi:MAG: TIR domain-containing protein [Methanomicrobiales archaeon]